MTRIKTSLLVVIVLLWSQLAMAGLPERKIIIEKGRFYYITVDDRSQLATLHEGDVKQGLVLAEEKRLPLGRPSGDPLLPLAFDIYAGQMTAINWVLNPGNSRYEAIRKLELSALKQDTAVEDAVLLETGFYLPPAAPFLPWYAMLKRNNVLHNNFFDLAVPDKNNILVALCNQGELVLSSWDGVNWKHSAPVTVAFERYFCLLSLVNKTFILGPEGDLFSFNKTKNVLEPVAGRKFPDLEQHTLVVDRDQDKVFMIGNGFLEPGPESLQQLLKKHALELTL